MKRLVIIVATVLAGLCANAQEDMKEIYKKEIDHSFDYTANGDDSGYSYASSSKEISVFNNKTGELLWNKKYKEISDQLGKVDDVISMWDAKVIFVFDRKIGKDKMAAIDATTGALLWISAKYQDVDDADNIIFVKELNAFAVTTKDHLTLIRTRTGEEIWETDKFKGIVGDFELTPDGSLILINMKATLIGSLFSGMKNQIVRINSKNGDIIWDQTYRGVVEKKILTRERLVKLTVEDGKVFLYMNGIQVFDFADGKPLWAAVYDQTPSEVVKNKKPSGATKFGAYGVVAQPLVVGEHIYVLDLINKRNQYLKKYELKTGKMVWTSPEIKDARAIPGIYAVGDKIILQVGGQVELQYTQKVKQSDGSFTLENTIEMENVKPLNIQCFNANTGEQVWESEKMKKGLTNLFLSGNNIIVCSGKALYSMEVATGKENYEKPLKEDNIGEADFIIDYNDEVIILGEKGVSERKKSDGSLTAASKFKRSTPITYNGQYVYGGKTMALYTKSSDYAVYDLKTVKYKSFDARKGASAYLSDDGLSLYVFESGGMMRKSKFTKLSAE
ncbi:MAG: PQQ-binding-like beta-propeller repeat protein [Bacteroidota bacterium]